MHRRRVRLTALALALALALLPGGDDTSFAQAARPLTEARLLEYVSDGIEAKAIVAKIRKDGIAFPVDAAAIERLKAGGVTQEVLDALREASAPAPPGGLGAPLTTFKDVLAALRMKQGEGQILDRLKGSPTIFTFDDVQEAALRSAGASDRLLEALQGRRPPSPGSEVTNLAVILDCSNSMNLPAGRGPSVRPAETKMAAARRIVSELIRDIPEGLKLTFIIYGHDRARACDAVDVARPLSVLGADDRSSLIGLIGRLPAVGSTPIARALQVAGRELARDPAPAGLILISDGVDTCNGDPSAEAARLASELNLSFGVNVIGFDVKADERAKLDQIAKQGRGTYYNAQNAAELRQVVRALHRRLDGPVVVKTNQGESLRFAARGSSWADRVVAFRPAGTLPESARDPQEALGMPNYDPQADNRYVALGSTGELVLEFVDNVLIDGPGPDLAIFEIGPLVEGTRVAISTDGTTWIDVGKAAGGKATLDISGFVEAGQKFRFVKLKDDDNGGDGADIDAIGALNSLPVEPE